MADLQAELDRAKAERDRLDVVIAYLEERVATAANGSRPAATPPRRTQRGKPTTVAAAIEALHAAGKPLKTPDLLRAVQELGAQVKDTDNLTKAMERHSKPPAPTFKRAGRGIWTLA